MTVLPRKMQRASIHRKGGAVWGAIALSGCAVVTAPTTTEQGAVSVVEDSSPPAIAYTIHELPSSRVHVVTVPPGDQYQVAVDTSETLYPLVEFAQAAGAIAAVNAGFFDPQNGLTTSPITMNGKLIADPRLNPRLVENPDLAPYLDAILDRSEFRIYDCDGTAQYDITRHSAPAPGGCRLREAVGAGPQLLPTMTGLEEGFLAQDEQGTVIRDAIGSQSPNARSAVGLKADGTLVLAIAAQRPDANQPTGLSLEELATFLDGLGVEKALNLDGGSSSGLYFEGETYYGRLDPDDRPIERPIKSILLVR